MDRIGIIYNKSTNYKKLVYCNFKYILLFKYNLLSLIRQLSQTKFNTMNTLNQITIATTTNNNTAQELKECFIPVQKDVQSIVCCGSHTDIYYTDGTWTSK